VSCPLPGPCPFGDIERAFRTGRITRWDLGDLGLEEGEVGFEGSATKVLRLYRPPPKQRGEVATGSTKELVERIIQKLESLSIIDEEEQERMRPQQAFGFLVITGTISRTG
jgi:hypothetical protein